MAKTTKTAPKGNRPSYDAKIKALGREIRGRKMQKELSGHGTLKRFQQFNYESSKRGGHNKKFERGA